MPKYLLTYHGSPDFTGPEEGQDHMIKWREWSAGLGDAVVDPGMPVGPSKTITPTGVVDNGGSNPVSGITILQADSIEAAIELARDCPHLRDTGTIEVSEALEMEM